MAMLKYLSILSVLIPLVVGLLLIQKLDKDSRIMLLLIFLASFPQLINLFIDDDQKMNWVKGIFYNTYTMVEVLIYTFFFARIIKSSFWKRVFWVTLFIYFIWVLYNLSGKGIRFEEFQRLWVAVANLYYLIMVLVFLFRKYLDPHYVLSSKSPLFWFCISLVVYPPLTFLRFYMSTFDSGNSSSGVKLLDSIHGVFNVLLYLLIAIGFYMNRYRKAEAINLTEA